MPYRILGVLMTWGHILLLSTVYEALHLRDLPVVAVATVLVLYMGRVLMEGGDRLDSLSDSAPEGSRMARHGAVVAEILARGLGAAARIGLAAGLALAVSLPFTRAPGALLLQVGVIVLAASVKLVLARLLDDGARRLRRRAAPDAARKGARRGTRVRPRRTSASGAAPTPPPASLPEGSPPTRVAGLRWRPSSA